MSVTYIIDSNNNFIYITGEGETSNNDWLNIKSELFDGPEDRLKMNLLIDVRDLETLPSTSFIESFINTLESVKESTIKWAIVVSKKVSFGLARVASAFAEFKGYNVEIFQNRDEAENWLEI